MKKGLLFLSISFILLAGKIQGQIYDPVKWTAEAKSVSNDEADIFFYATIENGWHLYGHYIPEGGPVPTSFTLNSSDKYDLSGKLIEVTKGEEKFDETFGMNLKLFSNNAIFKQRIKIKSNSDFILTGIVQFMCCNDEMCIPPKDVEWEIKVKGAKPKVAEEKQEATKVEDKKDEVAATATVAIEEANEDTSNNIENATLQQDKDEITDIQSINEPKKNNNKEDKSLLSFFLLAFFAGLAGILTPCVFPMIPMTVSFFMRGSQSKAAGILRGLVFGISIIVIYTLIGLVVSLTSAGADFANTLSTHWIPNTIFFIFFLVFAASFFGMFELVLPGSLANKVNAKAEKGGLTGAFFMALTLVIVSFSCTGPIVGALLVEAASGEVLKPTLGMFGFSLAFALPFTIFALFPSLLKSMPKSGGWLNSVKVVLGFIILAFSFKFLSALDQHQSILTREIYLAIWIVVFTLLGMYLLGKIKLSHDSELKHIGVFRLLLAIASFTFAVYMVPGLFGAPLKGISPLIPPKTNNSFDLTNVLKSGRTIENNEKTTLCNTPKYSDFLDLPHGLEGYFDYEEGIACAKEQNKPILLDFKGHQCSNCKQMEAKVWSDPEVLERLSKEFIIIALYVDDNTKLPEEEWIKSTYDGKIKKTIGKKNLDFEISRFNSNAQPLYFILDPQGDKLVERGYANDLNIQHFIDFLDEGIAAFKEND
ncbi:MAG: thioredoxin family protein [Bacteroidales bacterium]|nr:thioredoxin family protein [Bacteroidales bacterium]